MMKELDQKILKHFGGKVVRKDLTKNLKSNAVVPTYVLEYLLGQHCSTSDEEIIKIGIEKVRDIISNHFVHRDEAQVIKSLIREKGNHRIIDKVSVDLNDRKDRYEASFANLGLNRIVISDEIIKNHQKLLSHGVWCIVTVGYVAGNESAELPWVIENLKPIQISGIDVEEYKTARKEFTKDEWIDLLMQSIGLNPEEFNFRTKLLQLSRLIAFVENNYNLIELGPKGTGKSHIFSEMSPHGILISGGEVSKAKLFVNNSNGQIGLVGYWDVVAYDEFAGKSKRVDKGLVDIMKNYMANKSFSRGTHVYGATASMVFVGNTDHSVPYMLKHSDLFDALPKDYYDTAFLDRIHAYIPGWEVQKLRNEMFTSDYGFIVDYLAENLKELRKEDYTQAYKKYFKLSDDITTRDRDAITKTMSGLIKIIYPNGDFTEEQAIELLDFAIENRKRVKQQLIKMDETFEEVDFSYTVLTSGKKRTIETLEIIQYGVNPQKKIVSSQTEEVVGDNIITAEKENSIATPKLEAGQRIILDNQKGISYNKLFGDYLVGATEIKVVDPFVRLPYQMRNFMELCHLIVELKNDEDEVTLHLTTDNNEFYVDESIKAFSEMADSLAPLGIDFHFDFDETIHDRSITLNNGWKIILGRGLDLWQKTNGWYDIAEYAQEMRVCKASEVTFIREG